MNEDNSEINFDDLTGSTASNKSGIYRLWLAVLISAFFSLKLEKDQTAGARDFLFNENPFFDHVADGLGYEPSALRERVKKALKKDQF
jgi:hypothetical protein